MLTAIRNRLSDFHRKHTQSDGHDREEIIQRESAELCKIATELGIFKKLDRSFSDLHFDATGSEHAVAYNNNQTLIKTTIPDGGFGLIPKVTYHKQINLESNETKVTKQIEFLAASPLEYLDRWQLCNELFNDCVNVEKVVQWKDKSVSIIISQPYYMGDIVTHQVIESAFIQKGWQLIHKAGRIVFYNFAYDAIALDFEPRNCYMAPSGLQPFDLIVSHPDNEMSHYLDL